jgi:hypothetical protein
MSANHRGQVVTFYSYSGGTGRTMAVANVAWILAAHGKQVLVADWDLEAPGLDRFFHPFLDSRRAVQSDGVINLIREYEWATTGEGQRPGDLQELFESYARVGRHARTLNWEFPGGGRIDFLPAGVQRLTYAPSVASIDWDVFHSRMAGGRFLDELRMDMKANYDYALIDSRTGFSDLADICTIHLPDTLVVCFTYSSQGIDGASEAAAAIQTLYGGRKIRILPVPMRVDSAEQEKERLGRSLARHRFDGLPNDMSDKDRDAYWNSVAIPYRAFYAYEETLATFWDEPGSPTSLLNAYETLTRHITRGEITSMPAMDTAARARVRDRFTRRSSLVEDEVVLRFHPAEHVWAEWVEHILTSAGVRVTMWPSTVAANPAGDASTAREMRIVSARNEDMKNFHQPKVNAGPLVVYVDSVPPLPGSAFATYQSINGVSAAAAADRVLELVGRKGMSIDVEGMRFPGAEPAIFKAPARNSYFTGREAELLNVRRQLLSEERGRIAVVSGPVRTVSLQGMGGIGKTWVALEYAYRYRSSYDLVWWIRSDPTTFIDTEIADLGRRLGLLPNLPQPTASDMVRATRRALEQGEPYSRWLLIFDNAEDVERVGPFLPQIGGHILLTSRDLGWRDHSRPIALEVFRREESMAHLRGRVTGIRAEEANGVASMLGDLPIAVAAAAAWLADTATPVAAYLSELERLGAYDPAVEQTWNLALNNLQESSPAAYRLLQLCSVMGPEIHTDLIYSDMMAEALTDFDPSVIDRYVRGRMVQRINKLSLLKVDIANSQLLVHRVLQSVVRARMTDDERRAARHAVHRVLAAARPRGEIDDSTTWPQYHQLWPHLEVSQAEECDEEGMRELLIDRVRFLYLATGSDEDHATALRIAARVDDTWQGQLDQRTGEEHATVLRQLLHMRHHTANLVRAMGDFGRSRDLDEATHNGQVALLGAGHPHSLMTAGGLAADLGALGRYAEALELAQETYDTWVEQFGPDYPRSLAALTNLATSFRHMGNFRRALELDQEALSRRRVVSGNAHPATLVTASNLARDLRDAGEYERSVELLRPTVDLLQHEYGDEFRTTLNTRTNLAISLRSAGLTEEAAAVLDKAYIGLIDTAGKDSPDTLACRLSRAVNLLALASAHDDQTKIEFALAELSLVRDGYQAFVGQHHPHTLLCVNNLAAAARAAAQLERARDLAEQAVAGLTGVLGDRHPYTLAARMNLSICQAELGEAATAVDALEEVAGLLALVLGFDHPDTLRCLANVVLGKNALGMEQAGGARTRVLEQLTGKLGRNHPAVEALRQGRFLHRVVEPHPF